MKQTVLILSLILFVLAGYAPISAEAGPPPHKPINFGSGEAVTIEFFCPARNQNLRITLTPILPDSTYFDPHDFQGYEEVVPFKNPTIKVDIWLTHSGWSETAENPSDVIRQCVEGGNDASNWELLPESDIWAMIDLMQSYPVIVTQGEHTMVMDIKAITIVGHDQIETFSQDIRGIPGLLAEIDPRFESLLNFNATVPPVSDFFLITCLWGPYGTSWAEYSRVHEYYSYSRLVLWLTLHIDSQEGSIP